MEEVMHQLYDLLLPVLPTTIAKIAIWISILSFCVGLVNIVKFYEDRPFLRIEEENNKCYLFNDGLRSARNVRFFRSFLSSYNDSKVGFIGPKSTVEIIGLRSEIGVYPVYSLWGKVKVGFRRNKLLEKFRAITSGVKRQFQTFKLILYLVKILQTKNKNLNVEYFQLESRNDTFVLNNKMRYNNKPSTYKTFKKVNPDSFLVKNIPEIFEVKKTIPQKTNYKVDWEIVFDKNYNLTINYLLFFDKPIKYIKNIYKSYIFTNIAKYTELLNEYYIKNDNQTDSGCQIIYFEKNDKENCFYVSSESDYEKSLTFTIGKIIKCVDGFVLFEAKKDLDRLKYKPDSLKENIVIFDRRNGSLLFYMGNKLYEHKIEEEEVLRLLEIFNSCKTVNAFRP